MLLPPDPISAPPELAETAPIAGSLHELIEANDHLEPIGGSMECLASAVYFEARGEPLTGQLAVAEVVLNRTREARFAPSVCGVVRQPKQFSFVKRGRIPQAPRDTKAWKTAAAIAHIAVNKLWETPASRALYFHADYVSPAWRHSVQRQARLGAHIFYR